MYEKLDVLTTLLKKAEQLNDNNSKSLPDEHKNTSLGGATDTISYHQGYRDGIQSLLSIIQTLYDDAYHQMDEETDRMYLEHLRQRCADIYAKDGEMIDVGHMTKENCITFLKDSGVWEESGKKTREQLADERELEMIDK